MGTKQQSQLMMISLIRDGSNIHNVLLVIIMIYIYTMRLHRVIRNEIR